MAAPSIQEVREAVEQLDKILEFTHEATVGQHFLTLLEAASTLIVHRLTDPETGEEDGYTVTTICLPASKPVTCTREELLDTLRAAYRQEQGKKCGLCGVVKPLSAFCRIARSRDGHHHRCKLCERQRVSAYERNRSRASAAAT